MKYFSKAILALSLLAAASAVQAQTTYYGTDFDGSAGGYPYNDGTNYGGAFNDLNNVGGWTVTPDFQAVTVDIGGVGSTNTVAQLYSGSATGASAAHGLNGAATVGGFLFQTDFGISDAGTVGGLGAYGGVGTVANTGNTYQFNFTNAVGTNVFSIRYAPSLSSGGPNEGTPTPQLLVAGVQVATASQGPVIDQFFHLTVSVDTAGNIVASMGSAQSTLTSPLPVALAADGITGFSVSETDSAGAGGDFVQFDNISLAVPEPSTYAMMGLGLLGMLGLMKFRRAKV